MRRITNAVDPGKMRELLQRAPRSCLAFASEGVVELVPVEFRFQQGRYWIGMSGESGPVPGPDEVVKLLIDEGTYYFDMRGIWIRGRTSFSEERPDGGAPALNWFELVPEKSVAWDFGVMRVVEDR